MRQYLIEKQHDRKKLHAYERITLLLDKDSFREIGSGVENYRMNRDMDGTVKSTAYDGVITGHGTVFGRPVFVFAQDFTISGGSIGLNHGRKIAHVIELAIKAKCPVIGIYDSGGARIGEGINALAGCGEMIYQNTRASGVIPQIAVIAGPCAGAAAYSPAINDFVFVIKQIGQLYITGSKVIESVTGEKCDLQELGGAKTHESISGVAHFTSGSEKKCFARVRQLLSMLPASREDRRHLHSEGFIPGEIDLSTVIPRNEKLSYSMGEFIEKLVDAGSFLEVHRQFAKNVVVGFAQLSGLTVGIVANNPQVKSGCLDINSSDKASRFVRFCDAFSIPILTLVDTPGYLPGVEEEHGGIIRHGAKLLFAYSEATTIKITMILRKAYGGAYIAMGSRHLGADMVYASPYAEVAVMGAEGAVSILHHRELEKAGEHAKDQKDQLVREYRSQYLNSHMALAEGYVDEILNFEEIRKRFYEDILLLKNKQDIPSQDKHGNIPL